MEKTEARIATCETHHIIPGVEADEADELVTVRVSRTDCCDSCIPFAKAASCIDINFKKRRVLEAGGTEEDSWKIERRDDAVRSRAELEVILSENKTRWEVHAQKSGGDCVGACGLTCRSFTYSDSEYTNNLNLKMLLVIRVSIFRSYRPRYCMTVAGESYLQQV